MPAYYPEDEPIYRDTSPLSAVRTRLTPEVDDESYLPPVTVAPHNDPGLHVLLPTLRPDHDDSTIRFGRAMTGAAATGQAEVGSGVATESVDQNASTHVEPPTTAGATHMASKGTNLSGDPEDLASRTTRVDSAQDHEEDASKPPSDSPAQEHMQKSLPKLNIDPSSTEDAIKSEPRESIANSPTLSKHMQSMSQSTADTLPAVQTKSPSKDMTLTSPQAPSLPSIRHLTDLAEAAMQQDPRGGHQHSHSINSAIPPSPLPQYLPPTFNHTSSHTTPSSYHTGYNGPSPTSTVGDMSHYPSPHAMQNSSIFPDRRRSASMNGRPPPFLSAGPSTSSSNESYGHMSSSTDGYSTSHSTPVDINGSNENIARPTLPPLPGMTVMPTETYRCDYPGCAAAPFQTQYLLSSHRNVHSSVRSHYCPVPGCARAEGGKGFKRKNEMIRHGLVHSSPGYICPFCPDREHRYPRPDNLQRHVRVHHDDKDKDDPALRVILAQRLEGDGKQRRRRTQGSVSSLNNETGS